MRRLDSQSKRAWFKPGAGRRFKCPKNAQSGSRNYLVSAGNCTSGMRKRRPFRRSVSQSQGRNIPKEILDDTNVIIRREPRCLIRRDSSRTRDGVLPVGDSKRTDRWFQQSHTKDQTRIFRRHLQCFGLRLESLSSAYPFAPVNSSDWINARRLSVSLDTSTFTMCNCRSVPTSSNIRSIARPLAVARTTERKSKTRTRARALFIQCREFLSCSLGKDIRAQK
jgi:hypothetical protein